MCGFQEPAYIMIQSSFVLSRKSNRAATLCVYTGRNKSSSKRNKRLAWNFSLLVTKESNY